MSGTVSYGSRFCVRVDAAVHLCRFGFETSRDSVRLSGHASVARCDLPAYRCPFGQGRRHDALRTSMLPRATAHAW
jgi:hypothetical protein